MDRSGYPYAGSLSAQMPDPTYGGMAATPPQQPVSLSILIAEAQQILKAVDDIGNRVGVLEDRICGPAPKEGGGQVSPPIDPSPLSAISDTNRITAIRIMRIVGMLDRLASRLG